MAVILLAVSLTVAAIVAYVCLLFWIVEDRPIPDLHFARRRGTSAEPSLPASPILACPRCYLGQLGQGGAYCFVPVEPTGVGDLYTCWRCGWVGLRHACRPRGDGPLTVHGVGDTASVVQIVGGRIDVGTLRRRKDA